MQLAKSTSFDPNFKNDIINKCDIIMIKLPYSLGVIIPLKKDVRANNPHTKNLRGNKFVIRKEWQSFSPSQYEEKIFKIGS